MEASLREKEVLLQEINHRVKNNLQVISSLLALESRHLNNEQANESFTRSRARIKSMALIHEKLYQSKDLSKIDFRHYIRDLADSLFRTYEVDPGTITLKMEVEDVSVPLDAAIPCGLIINELVSNSLKHAFSDGERGEISIGLSAEPDDGYVLTVSDTGRGFSEGPDYSNGKDGFGRLLVSSLVDQLGATAEVSWENGTRFEMKVQGRREGDSRHGE